MQELNRTKETKKYICETLEMRYKNQEEFDRHSAELHEKGWKRNIYSQMFNFDTGEHEYVFYYRDTEVKLIK